MTTVQLGLLLLVVAGLFFLLSRSKAHQSGLPPVKLSIPTTGSFKVCPDRSTIQPSIWQASPITSSLLKTARSSLLNTKAIPRQIGLTIPMFYN